MISWAFSPLSASSHTLLFSLLHFTSQQMGLSKKSEVLSKKYEECLGLENKVLEVPSLSVHLPGDL